MMQDVEFEEISKYQAIKGGCPTGQPFLEFWQLPQKLQNDDHNNKNKKKNK